jgi:Tol biopolymer transport system component
MPNRITALAGAVLAVITLVGSVAPAYPSPATFPGTPGEIAFISARFDQDIFVVNADGSGVRELAHDPATATGPVPSPGGESIAFTSTRDGNREVYVMAADGSAQRRVTQDPVSDIVHDWSPDGSELAIVSDRGGMPQIYAVRADGRGVRQLTSGSVASDEPAWSPDGRRVAFVRLREIWVMAADGTGQRPLTNDPASAAGDPAWSPDGSKIAYIRARQAFPFDIVSVNTMNSDGMGIRTIATLSMTREPAWSPDGHRVALVTGANVYLMNADGSDRRQLTDSGTAGNEIGDDAPRWLGDGRRIVFTRAVGSSSRTQLYVVKPAGGTPRRLTSEVGGVMEPDWSPDGRTLAFVHPRRSLNRDIYLLTVDSSSPPRRLVRGETPAWSPDGRKLAFTRRKARTREGLYVITLRGGRVRMLARGGHSPAWAPNGRSIVFVRGEWPDTTLWTIRSDGSQARRLMPGAQYCTGIGKRKVHHSRRRWSRPARL